jgi:hypothetical protein
METMTTAIARGGRDAGRRFAAELEARGNQVRPLSRHAPEYRVDLARTGREVTGHRALLVPMPVPETVGRALRSGALTAPRPDVRGATGCTNWLRSAPG